MNAAPALCILTPDAGYEEHWQPVADRYRALLGDATAFRTWHDAGDLGAFDLVLPLIAWGYHRAPDKWLAALDAWEAGGVNFSNDINTLRWNSNKSYLRDLAENGVATVSTLFTKSLGMADIVAARAAFGEGQELVIKPAISGGADGTFRLAPDDPIPEHLFGCDMLIQPMMPKIASEGEYSLFYFGGVFSHAILKTPAAGDFRVQEQFGGREVSVTPPPGTLVLAQAALAAAPAPTRYARVDMVRGSGDVFALMELELIEPSLFLDFAADGGAAFARAILGQASP
jgi:glutathione synthase/RimK-type ligase-like ATP-grasp enzyme